jgi:hypothetical protein
VGNDKLFIPNDKIIYSRLSRFIAIRVQATRQCKLYANTELPKNDVNKAQMKQCAINSLQGDKTRAKINASAYEASIAFPAIRRDTRRTPT